MNKIRQKAQLKTQLAESQARLDALGENLNDAKLATKTFIMNNSDEFLQIAEGKAALSEYVAKEAELKALHETEKASHAQLQSDYDAISLTFTQADLADQYSQIDAAKEQISALTVALDQARQKSENPPALVDTVTPLKTELQSVLVSAAMGVDGEKDITRLEKSIAAAVASDTMANKATLTASKRLVDTLSGIELRLNDDRLALANLEEDAKVIKAVLLGDKAQTIAAEYAQAAQKTLSALLKLMALDAELMKETGRASGLLPHAAWNISLPKTPGMADHRNYSDGRHFIDAERHALDIDKAYASLRAELTSEGFRL